MINLCKFAILNIRCRGRVARQWSATPSTAVRIRSTPQKRFKKLKRFFLYPLFKNCFFITIMQLG